MQRGRRGSSALCEIHSYAGREQVKKALLTREDEGEQLEW